MFGAETNVSEISFSIYCVLKCKCENIDTHRTGEPSFTLADKICAANFVVISVEAV